jgi:CRISPR-associated protein Cas2
VTGEKHIVICYDCADDQRRARLARLLADYGTRIQESVFECVLDDGLLDQLEGRLRELMDGWPEDRVHVFPLCERCERGVVALGDAPRARDEPFTIV